MTAKMKQRRGTAALWTSTNPVLADGQIGYETDTRKMKVGDGVTAWVSLNYTAVSAASVALDDLTDVTITAAASGDILRHNGTAWVDAVGTTFYETAGAVATHEADTTSVHGIADTSTLYRSGGTDVAVLDGGTGSSTAAGARTNLGLGTLADDSTIQETFIVAVGDETTAITTGTAKVTFRMPFALTVTAVRASLTTVSSSGIPTVDINEGGTTILSTKLTIDASEKTSTTAATAAVISDSALADDAEITIDIDVAGTGAAGLKVYIIGTRAVA